MSIHTLVAQLVFQIALTIAVVINGLSIVATLNELDRRLQNRPSEVDINTIEDIRYLLEKIFAYLDIYTSYHL